MVTAGVDVGGTKVYAALVDEGGVIRHRVHRPTESDAGTASLLGALADVVEGRGATPTAIGVGVAAWVEYPSGRVVFAPNMHYEIPDIASVVSDRFGLPVVVENDANAAAWGEFGFGAGRATSHMLMLTVGTGIGGGIVIGGRLYRGSKGLAAEFGHMTILEGGPTCACGQRGCLEALASGTAIGRMAREGIGGARGSILAELTGGDEARITGALVAEAAHAGDRFAIDILDRAGRSLGVGMANLTQLFDPEMIVVGGGGAGAGDFLLEPAKLELARRLGPARETPAVVSAILGNDAGVIGAADLARLAVATA